MAKYRVLVSITRTYSVEVDAEDAAEARKSAAQEVKDGRKGRPLGDSTLSFPSVTKVTPR